MPTLRESDIRDLVGDVDPLTVSRLLAVGATREQLEQATLAPEDSSALFADRIGALREILADLERIEVEVEWPAVQGWR